MGRLEEETREIERLVRFRLWVPLFFLRYDAESGES